MTAVGKGLGPNQKKIVEAFENSNKKQAEVETLIYYVLGKIDSIDEIMKIDELHNKKENIYNQSTYKNILNSITRLEENGIIKKEYKNLSNSTKNKKILIVEYIDEDI